MITKKTLKLSLKSLKDFAKKKLPDEELIALDARDECPIEIEYERARCHHFRVQSILIARQTFDTGRRGPILEK